MFSDSVLIIFISMFTALLSEGFSWLLIYRTEKYKRLQSEVEKQTKKCNKLVSICSPIMNLFNVFDVVVVVSTFQVEKQKDTIEKNQKKKVERQEERLKTNSRELSVVKMKSMMTISFAFMALLSMFNSMYV